MNSTVVVARRVDPGPKLITDMEPAVRNASVASAFYVP